MRSLVITMMILIFGLLMSIMAASGSMPQVNTGSVSQWNGNSTQQLVISQNVTSNDLSGYIGFFNIGIGLIGKVFSIILGTLVVAVPICQLFGWSTIIVLIAGAIQTVLYALIGFDLLILWRGVQW